MNAELKREKRGYQGSSPPAQLQRQDADATHTRKRVKQRAKGKGGERSEETKNQEIWLQNLPPLVPNANHQHRQWVRIKNDINS